MKNVGCFNAITDDTFIYILAYPSREPRGEMWQEFGTQQDFQELIVQAERDNNLKPVDTIGTRLLIPTSYTELR